MKLTKHQLKKKKKGLCVYPRCMCQRADRKLMCHKHSMKVWRENNPEKAAYANLKANANFRGKEFDLSFEDFLSFLKQNPNYLKNKGRTVRKLHIDRIDSTKGYTLDNIRAITSRENCRKARLDKMHQNGEIPF